MIPHRFKYYIEDDVERLLSRSGLNLDTFRGKSVLVTGGTGFFGVWMLNALIKIKHELQNNFAITVLSRSPHSFLSAFPEYNFDKHVSFIEGQLSSFVTQNVKFTHLIHLATTTAHETHQGEDQLQKLSLLYEGTQNLMKQCGESLENVLFTSSGIVYGSSRKNKITEFDAFRLNTLNKGSALALGKLTAEYLTSYYSDKYNFNYSIARCFTFAGPYLPLDLHYAIGNFVSDAMQNKPIIVKSSGLDKRSYLFIGDAVAWLLRLLIEPKNEVFNVGSETTISVAALAQKVAAISKNKIKVQIRGGNAESGNFQRSSYIPDTKKIRLFYPNLQEWTPLDEIVSKMFSPRHQYEHLVF